VVVAAAQAQAAAETEAGVLRLRPQHQGIQRGVLAARVLMTRVCRLLAQVLIQKVCRLTAQVQVLIQRVCRLLAQRSLLKLPSLVPLLKEPLPKKMLAGRKGPSLKNLSANQQAVLRKKEQAQ